MMKKKDESRIVSIVISAFIALSGFLSLLIDGIFKPFLDSQPEVKMIIILVSVISAYHAFLMFSLKSIFKVELEKTNKNIKYVDEKIKVLNDSIPFSYLDEIERRHGCDNKSVNCEMWIIANTLQEAKNDDSVLMTIYDNITLNHVQYFYVLPDTQKSHLEINSLKSRLGDIHKKKKRKFTGKIQYRFDKNVENLITAEYFDIVLFIDCDTCGNPHLIGTSTTCEGFQCFSKISNENNYFYQSIDSNKILEIRTFHQSTEFVGLDLLGV